MAESEVEKMGRCSKLLGSEKRGRFTPPSKQVHYGVAGVAWACGCLIMPVERKNIQTISRGQLEEITLFFDSVK